MFFHFITKKLKIIKKAEGLQKESVRDAKHDFFFLISPKGSIIKLTNRVHRHNDVSLAVSRNVRSVDYIENNVMENPARVVANSGYNEIASPYSTGKHAQLKDRKKM